MSGISLQKRAEKVGILLQKKGINTAPIMRVGCPIDISGSMDRIIRSGALQSAFDITMGVAFKFDDNGELDVFAFDTRCDFIDTATPNNYTSFINDKRIAARGGTAYTPIINAAIDFYFGAKKSGGFLGFGKKIEVNNTPVLLLIYTDGEPGDSYSSIKRALEAAQGHPIYFHFIGVGGTRKDFRTIAQLADDLPNVGEVYLPRFDLSDDEVYEQVICDELVQWIGGHSGAATASA